MLGQTKHGLDLFHSPVKGGANGHTHAGRRHRTLASKSTAPSIKPRRLLASGGCSLLVSAHQRDVNQVLRQEPHLHLVCADDV